MRGEVPGEMNSRTSVDKNSTSSVKKNKNKSTRYSGEWKEYVMMLETATAPALSTFVPTMYPVVRSLSLSSTAYCYCSCRKSKLLVLPTRTGRRNIQDTGRKRPHTERMKKS